MYLYQAHAMQQQRYGILEAQNVSSHLVVTNPILMRFNSFQMEMPSVLARMTLVVGFLTFEPIES
jgi:hypothetical protein